MNRETIGLYWCPTNQGCRISRCPSSGGGCPDDGNRMEIAWRKTCDRSHLLPKSSFFGFLFGKQFQVFLKGRSGDVIPKGQVMSSQKVVWYWVNLPEFSPLLFAIHCNNRSQSLSQSFPSSKVLPATVSPYSGRSGVALATPSAPCSPCYTAAGAVVYSRGKRFGWSMATWQDQVLNKKVSL